MLFQAIILKLAQIKIFFSFLDWLNASIFTKGTALITSSPLVLYSDRKCPMLQLQTSSLALPPFLLDPCKQDCLRLSYHFPSLSCSICSYLPSFWASFVAQVIKNPPAMQETWVQFLGQDDPLEKWLATHSSILAWRIPWTEEPGRLQSMGVSRVGHDLATIPPPPPSLFFSHIQAAAKSWSQVKI